MRARKTGPSLGGPWEKPASISSLGARKQPAQVLSVPVTNRTCGRVICTWGCDNTKVDLFFYKSSEMFAK